MAFNYNGFKLLCQAPCFELFDWLVEELGEIYGQESVYASDRWAFFKGTNPVCLCAHLDTVHYSNVKEMYIEPELNIINSPQGIGGDDRCGVWIILRLLSEIVSDGKELPCIFFSTDEETGSASTRLACQYIKKSADWLIDSIKFFIQLDRKNEKDSVYYNCNNKEFEKYINDYGFVTALGTRTDICILCSEFGVSGVNLSCGFQGEHHVTETVNVNVMLDTANKVKNILYEVDKDKSYPYVEKIPTYTGAYYGGNRAAMGDYIYT